MFSPFLVGAATFQMLVKMTESRYDRPAIGTPEISAFLDHGLRAIGDPRGRPVCLPLPKSVRKSLSRDACASRRRPFPRIWMHHSSSELSLLLSSSLSVSGSNMSRRISLCLLTASLAALAAVNPLSQKSIKSSRTFP